MACWSMQLSWVALAMVVLAGHACNGLPLDRAEKAELEQTLDKMNALLDQLAKSLHDDSQPANHPQTSVNRPIQIEEEPEPDEPSIEGDDFDAELGQQEERSWDDGPEPEATSYLEPRSEEGGKKTDNGSLRAALRYLMQLEKLRQAKRPSVKRDHDIPFPFMDTGYKGRWGNQ